VKGDLAVGQLEGLGKEGDVMGWFLRKAFRFGPLRFNLSKSGVGISAGVKGARVGVDARGKGYVAGGRGGLYFRKRLASPGVATSPDELPESLRPQLPFAVSVVLVVGLAILGIQFQGTVCAVLTIAYAILGQRFHSSPGAPVFGAYFWPVLGLAVLLGVWWILWAARRDARIAAWLVERVERERRPITRDELRRAMGPDRPEDGP